MRIYVDLTRLWVGLWLGLATITIILDQAALPCSALLLCSVVHISPPSFGFFTNNIFLNKVCASALAVAMLGGLAMAARC